MPAFSASWIAARESMSSWPPQANPQPPPPIAQAPKPIGVMNRSEFPSCLVFMVVISFSLRKHVICSRLSANRYIPRLTLGPPHEGGLVVHVIGKGPAG